MRRIQRAKLLLEIDRNIEQCVMGRVFNPYRVPNPSLPHHKGFQFLVTIFLAWVLGFRIKIRTVLGERIFHYVFGRRVFLHRRNNIMVVYTIIYRTHL